MWRRPRSHQSQRRERRKPRMTGCAAEKRVPPRTSSSSRFGRRRGRPRRRGRSRRPPRATRSTRCSRRVLPWWPRREIGVWGVRTSQCQLLVEKVLTCHNQRASSCLPCESSIDTLRRAAPPQPPRWRAS